MFDVVLFLAFASLIVRFHSCVSRVLNNLDATADYVAQARNELKHN